MAWTYEELKKKTSADRAKAIADHNYARLHEIRHQYHRLNHTLRASAKRDLVH